MFRQALESLIMLERIAILSVRPSEPIMTGFKAFLRMIWSLIEISLLQSPITKCFIPGVGVSIDMKTLR